MKIDIAVALFLAALPLVLVPAISGVNAVKDYISYVNIGKIQRVKVPWYLVILIFIYGLFVYIGVDSKSASRKKKDDLLYRSYEFTYDVMHTTSFFSALVRTSDYKPQTHVPYWIARYALFTLHR